MRSSNLGRFRQQVRFLQRQFLQDGELPFADVLSAELVAQALTAANTVWKDRIYTPLTTLWIFLGQILDIDHSCRAAVTRFIAYRVSHGQSYCSAETGAYCQARKRLPEKFFSDIARQTGQALETNTPSGWLWKGKRVYAFDGSTVMMPDTPKNQADYPQNVTQKPGIGFPIARIAAIFSLSCGAIVDLGISRYAGKGQSELGILRRMGSFFRRGDILLGDRLMCTFQDIFLLQKRGVDVVSPLQIMRQADFRKGKRLGKGDHIIRWSKPYFRSLSWQAQKKLPGYITVRECRVRIERPGYRSRVMIVVTTLLDAKQYTKEDLAGLYRARWNAELDLRSLKQTLQMEMLRCKTPELVRKEIWVHMLAYNLIRTIMAQAAVKHSIEPRTISFKGTIQTLKAFQGKIASQGQHNCALRMHFYHVILDITASQRVANRPGRFEPRLIKRRHGKYDLLMKPRDETKRRMLKGVR